MKRVFELVLDSFGCGKMPDAESFGDFACNTLASVTAYPGFTAPNLSRLGLYNIEGVSCGTPCPAPAGAFARLTEASRGKDTTTGHWEMAGLVLPRPFPTYPDGFPSRIIREFERRAGRGVLCNRPYSGTQVIHDYGREHLKTGSLICYTSADSVFQIAAHEDLVPREELYRYCRIAREILTGEDGVGRVIARPFTGTYPNYIRTSGRHDFSLEPTGDTMLDVLKGAGLDVLGVGKIHDIFAGRGLTDFVYTVSNEDGMVKTDEYAARDFHGLCFVNFVDGDMLYGHRRDQKGYAEAIMTFDRWLGGFLDRMRPEDVLMITADHGCDPCAAGTDHTREYVPWLICGSPVRPENLGTRPSFTSVADTVLDWFDLPHGGHSVKNEILS